MNKERRKKLETAIEKLNEALELIDECKTEEEESAENLPDNLYYSEFAEYLRQNAEDMDYEYNNIEEAINNLQEVIER